MTTEPSSRSAGADGPSELQSPSEVLQRWEELGAVWHVVSRTPSEVTVALCACDGAEEMERLTSADPELFAWLAGRSSSETWVGP